MTASLQQSLHSERQVSPCAVSCRTSVSQASTLPFPVFPSSPVVLLKHNTWFAVQHIGALSSHQQHVAPRA